MCLCGLLCIAVTGCMTQKHHQRTKCLYEGLKEKPKLIFTRDDVLSDFDPFDPNWPEYDRRREYAEIDVNNNGLKDIIISNALHTEGTGGISYSVYICVDTNLYKKADVEIGGKVLALEEDWEGNRIWSYWRTCSNRGVIGYVHFSIYKGIIKSPFIEICPGDSGTGIGNDISKAIFKDNKIEFKIISPIDDN